MFGPFKKKQTPPPPPGPPPGSEPNEFPPVPKWKPSIRQPLDQIIERVAYYTNRKRDFAVFTFGTCAIVPNGLPADQAVSEAKAILSRIFHAHPDMHPRQMDDGNIGIQYNHPAINVVLEGFAQEHWAEIDRNHLGALAPAEVLITPLGQNKFDAFGKKALFGRCFMFMDATNPEVVRVVRAVA